MDRPDKPEDRPAVRVLFGDLRPGETPIDDFSGLRVPDIFNLRELAQHETRNIANAVVDYLRTVERTRIVFDIESVKSVHRDMFCDVWDWAGQFRQKDIDSIPFAFKWALIPDSVHNLLEDAKVWPDTGADVIEQSAWLHHRAVQIHPFPNGNGRWSRMLTNIWLLERRGTIVEWPPAIGEISPVRADYIKALKAADNGDYGPLTELHRGFTPMPARPVW
jgi:fido (protein-threonine AMPylation protein)